MRAESLAILVAVPWLASRGPWPAQGLPHRAVKPELPARGINVAAHGLAQRHMQAAPFEAVRRKRSAGFGGGRFVREFCDRVVRNDIDLGPERTLRSWKRPSISSSESLRPAMSVYSNVMSRFRF